MARTLTVGKSLKKESVAICLRQIFLGIVLDILCLDLEGVLVPEVWQAVAKETQIPELLKTTRDIPNYDDLMNYRLGIIDQHDITLSQIQAEIAN